MEYRLKIFLLFGFEGYSPSKRKNAP